MFRTSDAALIEKLYLTGYTPYPPRKEIQKVALGATETVPWEYHKDPVELVKDPRKQNIRIAVLEITDSKNLIWNVEKNDFPHSGAGMRSPCIKRDYRYCRYCIRTPDDGNEAVA
ncbi:MAG: hypothetical protein R3A12_16760 [Ignavibacteria bacterium]